MKRCFIILIFMPLLTVLCFPQNVDQAVSKAEFSLRSLKTLKADFEQIYYSGSISMPIKKKGQIWFQKPDLMKWEYKAPEKEIFLSKNGTFLYYIPEDNQVFRGRISQESHEGEVFFILSGQENIRDNYNAELSPFPTDEKNVLQLKLTPKEEGFYSHILLELDKKNGLIKKIILFDWTGSKNEIFFKRIKTNMRLSNKTFKIKYPSDAEIIEY